MEDSDVNFRKRLNKIKAIPTLLGFCPVHFKVWADNLETDIGYDSQLVRFLRDLAEKLEGDRIKET